MHQLICMSFGIPSLLGCPGMLWLEMPCATASILQPGSSRKCAQSVLHIPWNAHVYHHNMRKCHVIKSLLTSICKRDRVHMVRVPTPHPPTQNTLFNKYLNGMHLPAILSQWWSGPCQKWRVKVSSDRWKCVYRKPFKLWDHCTRPCFCISRIRLSDSLL